MNKQTFGMFIKDKRIQTGFTLREFCERFGLDVGYISRLENDLIPAPQKLEKLKGIAKALSIEESSSEWVTYFDLSSLSRNEIPDDIRMSFSENIHLVPMLLRATKNKKVTEKELFDLIKRLRTDVSE
jgi:transcriptional regulator with XRE-family HTH domain